MLVTIPLLISLLLPCLTLAQKGHLPIYASFPYAFSLQAQEGFNVLLRNAQDEEKVVPYIDPRLTSGPLFRLDHGNLTTVEGGYEAFRPPVPPIFPPLLIPLLFGKAFPRTQIQFIIEHRDITANRRILVLKPTTGERESTSSLMQKSVSMNNRC